MLRPAGRDGSRAAWGRGYETSTLISRGIASAARGRVTVRTPSRDVAVIAAAFTGVRSVKRRVKAPKTRSRRCVRPSPFSVRSLLRSPSMVSVSSTTLILMSSGLIPGTSISKVKPDAVSWMSTGGAVAVGRSEKSKSRFTSSWTSRRSRPGVTRSRFMAGILLFLTGARSARPKSMSAEG